MKDIDIATTLEWLAPHLRGLEFGSVEIVIHDGKAVQIDRRERHRLSPLPYPTTGGSTAPRRPSNERSSAAGSLGDLP